MEKSKESGGPTNIKEIEDDSSEYTYEYEEEKEEPQEINEKDKNAKEALIEEKIPETPKETQSNLNSEQSPMNSIRSSNNSSPSSKGVLLTSVNSPYVATQNKHDVESSNTEVPPLSIQEKDETDYMNAVNMVIRSGQKPDPEIYDDVLNYARRRLAESTISEDYDTCEEMSKCVTFLEENDDRNKKQNPVVTVEMRIEQTKQEIEDVNNKYKKRLADFDKASEMKMQEIMADQEAEMQMLEDRVSSPEFLHKFDKPSAQLQQVRVMQREKAMMKNFAGAKELKLIGDEMEKKETELAKRKVIEKIELLTKQKEEKHQIAIKYARQNWARRRTKIEQDWEAEITPLKTLLEQMEKKEHHSIKYAIKPRTALKKRLPKYTPTTPAITPRTMKSVNKYKKHGQSKLNLSDFEPRRYVRPKSAKLVK